MKSQFYLQDSPHTHNNNKYTTMIKSKAFARMYDYAQFILYKVTPSTTRSGKFDKIPCDASGKQVNAQDPTAWLDFDTAYATSELYGAGWGVGFVLTEGDPFFCLDIDNCLENGEWSKFALSMCQKFKGAAVEISQSNTGLHIFGTYSNIPEHACKNSEHDAELYHKGRFIALTGTNALGDVSHNCDAVLNSVVSEYFPVQASANPTLWTTTHHANSNPILGDEALIKKALTVQSAASVFSTKASFTTLWTRDAPKLADAYPDPQRDFDASSADAALAQHLAFWTGGDCERIERLMRQSALKRDKWDTHKSYIRVTVSGAVAKQTTFYKMSVAVDAPHIAKRKKAEIRTGFQFLGLNQQVDYFEGCTYVTHAHRVLMPNGAMLKPEQFKAAKGGYLFATDDTGEKTTKNAWEAFTESLGIHFPKADATVFRPELPFSELVESDLGLLVNTYLPPNILKIDGDVNPFLIHLAKLLPDERDRTILLSYMASVVQYKGYRIGWAPLIQGVEGNGKTFLTECLSYCVGEKYTHLPSATELGEKFNSWIFDKILIGVEDVYVPRQRAEVMEIIKPMITGKNLARRAMNTDQEMRAVCANFMFNSNHKDAIRKTKNDRRFCVFYTAQQDVADLKRDGMMGDYFNTLYAWANYRDGFAAIAHYLDIYQIPAEFDPKQGCVRAPTTSSSEEAVGMSLGTVESEVMEAVAQHVQGFANGWISSFALSNLLTNKRLDKQAPLKKRKAMLLSLGYTPHPALHEGRSHRATLRDGGRSTIYIHEDNPDCKLTDQDSVIAAYEKAQEQFY